MRGIHLITSYKNSAFSLIELMVVIAIVALLSAVAVSTYRTYTNKAKVVTVFNHVNELLQSVEKEFVTTGHIPPSIEFGGVTVYNGSYSVMTADIAKKTNIGILWYQSVAPDVSNGYAASFRIDVGVSNLNNFTGYQDPLYYGWAYNSLIRFVMKNYSNGTTVLKCGGYGQSGIYASQDLPAEYMPNGCTCTELGNFFFFNTTC